jgi:hypothetical protein
MIQRFFSPVMFVAISSLFGGPQALSRDERNPVLLMESTGKISQSVFREQDKADTILIYEVQFHDRKKTKVRFATSELTGDERLRAERKIGAIVSEGATAEDLAFLENTVAERLKQAQQASGGEKGQHLLTAKQALVNYLSR